MIYNYDVSLNVKDLNKLARQLNSYKNVTLRKNIERFVNLLANEGIRIAKASAKGEEHQFYESGMIVFEKVVQGQTARVIGRNDNLSELEPLWWDSDGVAHENKLSPILAIEYGTAGKAVAGHRGEIAIKGHENQNVWFWYADSELKTIKMATAVQHREPMYNAMQEMIRQITIIAKKVWG